MTVLAAARALDRTARTSGCECGAPAGSGVGVPHGRAGVAVAAAAAGSEDDRAATAPSGAATATRRARSPAADPRARQRSTITGHQPLLLSTVTILARASIPADAGVSGVDATSGHYRDMAMTDAKTATRATVSAASGTLVDLSHRIHAHPE